MATTSSETAFLTMEKSFTYRGGREHWSNIYHIDTVPLDTTHWRDLANAVWAKEQICFAADVQMERSYGHTPGSPPVLVYEDDYFPVGEGGVAGTWIPGGSDHPTSGDVATWVRYGTTQKTSRGKPIYLRNYYHGVYTGSTPDVQSGSQKTNMDALATAWVAGIVATGVTYHRAGPRGAVAQNHKVADFVTTRTLKHRGKRHKFDLNQSAYRWLLQKPPTLE